MSAVAFSTALGVWTAIGLNSFGGPAGQIAVMHRVLVEERRWISERRFLHALNYCMLLPGPEAQQLAIYVGWLLHGWRGGMVAGVLFVLPGALAMGTLAALYAAFGRLAPVAAVFFGLKAAVLAVVLEAVVRIGRRVLHNGTMVVVAALAFVAIFVFEIPFPWVVIGAGSAGLVGVRLAPDAFTVVGTPDVREETAVDALLDRDIPDHARPSIGRALRTAAVWLAVWLVPLGAVVGTLGSAHVYSRIALFFSQAAAVTFGGAYAVLAYVAQQAVDRFGWLTASEMLDGLGLAETTPGPLILVVEFVGFLAAWREPGTLPPLLAGILGALLTLWVTFAPCFLWIFVGAPYVEWLRGRRTLDAALSTITAAVVGAVLNLAVWFALHVLFGEVHTIHGVGRWLVPVWGTVRWPAVAIAAAAMVATFHYRVGMLRVLGASALVGLGWWALVG